MNKTTVIFEDEDGVTMFLENSLLVVRPEFEMGGEVLEFRLTKEDAAMLISTLIAAQSRGDFE